ISADIVALNRSILRAATHIHSGAESIDDKSADQAVRSVDDQPRRSGAGEIAGDFYDWRPGKARLSSPVDNDGVGNRRKWRRWLNGDSSGTDREANRFAHSDTFVGIDNRLPQTARSAVVGVGDLNG